MEERVVADEREEEGDRSEVRDSCRRHGLGGGSDRPSDRTDRDPREALREAPEGQPLEARASQDGGEAAQAAELPEVPEA